MLSLFAFKILAAVAVTILILATGLLPLRFALRNKQFLHLGDAFAGGIFLSSGLLHLLPEAEQTFLSIYGTHSYPYAQLICIFAFVILLLLERGVVLYGKYWEQLNPNRKSILTPYLLFVTLAVHSFIGGAALGLSNSLATALVIFLAIIMHKGSESIALVSNLCRYAVPPKRISWLIFMFSWLTPLGVLAASITDCSSLLEAKHLPEAIFNAVAAGTFLYLGSIHIMECEKSFEDLGEITALILGISLMGIVAIWI